MAAEAEQPGVVAEAARDVGLAQRLRGAADQAGDQEQRALGPVRRGLGGDAQHRLVQPRLADRELRGVDADRQARGAGVDVVAA